jgi:hypothetical protein
MQIPKRPLHYLGLACAGISLLLCSGCVTVPAGYYANMLAYQPVRSPVQIDASATVAIAVTMTPEAIAFWKGYGGNSDTNIANYRSGRAATLRNDLATSGLFARIAPDNEPADYNVKIEWIDTQTQMYPGEVARVTITAKNTKTGEGGTASVKITGQDKIPEVMATLKATLATGLQQNVAREQAVLFAKEPLPELIASSDASSACAGERNRALIAAKIKQLPVLLREKNTEELTALVVKIEQTMLDLNHGSEMAKDRAQQMAAENSAAPQIAELRGLAVSYQERIELLKPIAAALKEEIANRNR